MDSNLKKYRAFLKAVDTGSFTKAAAELNYTQSAVSKMVADLEQDWGVALIERTRGGLTLTSAGYELMPKIRSLINEWNSLQESLDALKGVRTGRINIGSFSSVAIHWLPELIEQFRKDFPGINYEILMGDYEEIERWILDGRVDCGFLSLPSGHKMDTMLLKEDEYVVVLPEGHALCRCPQIDLNDLSGEDFLLLEHGGKTEVSEILEMHHVRPRITLSTWEDYAIMAMVEKGLGVAILPRMILKRIPYQIVIRPMKEPYYRKIGFAVKNRSAMSPSVKVFQDYLDRKLRQG